MLHFIVPAVPPHQLRPHYSTHRLPAYAPHTTSPPCICACSADLSSLCHLAYHYHLPVPFPYLLYHIIHTYTTYLDDTTYRYAHTTFHSTAYLPPGLPATSHCCCAAKRGYPADTYATAALAAAGCFATHHCTATALHTVFVSRRDA